MIMGSLRALLCCYFFSKHFFHETQLRQLNFFKAFWSHRAVAILSLIARGKGENLKREVEITIAIIISPFSAKTFEFLIKKSFNFIDSRNSIESWSSKKCNKLHSVNTNFSNDDALLVLVCRLCCTNHEEMCNLHRFNEFYFSEKKKKFPEWAQRNYRSLQLCDWKAGKSQRDNSSVCSTSILRSNKKDCVYWKNLQLRTLKKAWRSRRRCNYLNEKKKLFILTNFKMRNFKFSSLFRSSLSGFTWN